MGMTLVGKPSPRLVIAIAGTSTLLALAATARLQHVALPYDAQYGALLQLMWSGTEQWLPGVGLLFAAMRAMAVVAGVSALGCALLPFREGGALTWGVRERMASVAAVVGLYTLCAHLLGRLAANVVYGTRLEGVAPLDGVLLRLEGGFISGMQEYIGSPVLREVAAAIYSVGWLGALLAALPIAVIARQRRLVWVVALGPLCVAGAAMPLHILLPVHDPWSLNPTYGFTAELPSTVQFMNPRAAPELLGLVATSMRTVVASCMPSLHVMFPAFFAVVFARARKRTISACYWFATAVVFWATVLLGRHWVSDGIAAIFLAVVVGTGAWRIGMAKGYSHQLAAKG